MWQGAIACLDKGRKLGMEQYSGIAVWRVYHFAFFTRSDACVLRCIGLCVAGWLAPDNDRFFFASLLFLFLRSFGSLCNEGPRASGNRESQGVTLACGGDHFPVAF